MTTRSTGPTAQPADGDRRDLAKELFADLSEAGPDERARLLDAFPPDDPVRAEAERLLRALDGAEGFMEEPASARALPDSAWMPPAIGPYTPLERLGEGGFGIVYRALQTHPVEREVAVKVLRFGLESPQVLARFTQERRFLARLDHPDVVRVLDAGTTQDGRLYVVMDLAPGSPITRFVREHDVPIDQRLRLFSRVCRAVHAVHQRAVIHRDLKPSNIVVSQSDEGPRPRIIDFGIATALDAGDRDGWTQLGTPIGTPRYASPEQASASDAVDTRTDIYALGMILGEMLTGAVPRAAATGAETSAVAPSKAASDAGDRALSRRLRGDIDRIVLKAVAWEASRRYDSAAGLADDIDRHLAGLPVLASSPGKVYTARKFIARNRLASAACIAALLALVAGLIVSLAATREANNQRRIAEANSRRAAFIGSFLLNTIERNADPDARGRDVVLDEEALRTVASEAIDGLADDPETMLDLLETIGLLQYKVGLLTDAPATLQRALDHTRLIHPGPSDRAVRIMMLLAQTLEGDHTRSQLASDIRRQAAADAELLFAEDDPRLLSVKIRTTSSLDELERIVALLEADPSALPDDVITGLTRIYWRLEFGPEPWRGHQYARKMYERSLAHYGPSHSLTVNAMTTYANSEAVHGSPQKALALLIQAFEQSLATFGPDHHHTDSAQRLLARLYGTLGEPLSGIPHAREHEERTRRLYGEHSVQHAGALSTLGSLTAQAGDLHAARDLLTESLAATRKHWPDGHNMRTPVETRLAEVLLSLGELDAADELATTALRLMPIKTMANPYAMATAVRVRVLLARGMHEEAASLVDETVSKFDAAGVTGRPIDTLRAALPR